MSVGTSLAFVSLFGPALLLAAQSQPPADPPAPAPVSRVALPSATLQPSLDVLRTALTEIHLDRWKASSAVRDETQNNVGSIQRDVQSTLPGLLSAADAAPGSAAKILPAYRNVDALYDVLLRVDAAARVSAPPDQTSAIDQALAHLEDGRRTLGEQLQHNAEAQEVQVVQLQAALKAVPPPAPPPQTVIVPAKCPAPPVRKKKPATTTAAKPATPSSSQNSSSTSH